MRATIDGESLTNGPTRSEGLALRLLRFLQCHSPEDRGRQVLIYLDNEELFEGFSGDTKDMTPDQVLTAMKLLAFSVNQLHLESVKEVPTFDQNYNISLPNPNDVKLEVVMEGSWRDGVGLVDPRPVFQILTEKWVGPIPFNDGYVNNTCYLPVPD